jgi:hypothetical protein
MLCVVDAVCSRQAAIRTACASVAPPRLAHDPEKGRPGLRKRLCSTNNVGQDDNSMTK